jgi:hypothetical protein
MTPQFFRAVAEDPRPIPNSYCHQRILVALDSSDHANAAMQSALELARLDNSAIVTGSHVYAAKMHDLRFRQMEGGLPEQFRQEPISGGAH